MSRFDRLLFHPVLGYGVYVAMFGGAVVIYIADPGTITFAVAIGVTKAGILGVLGYCILGIWVALEQTIRKAVSDRDSS